MTSEPFTFIIQGGVKQPLFSIFFSLLLNFVLRHSAQDTQFHTRSDGKLFNVSRQRTKTKVYTVLIREMLFVDDVALTSHTEELHSAVSNVFPVLFNVPLNWVGLLAEIVVFQSTISSYCDVFPMSWSAVYSIEIMNLN